MRGSILIVARNNLKLTKIAVRSALDQDVPCDVMVIDNASTDGTAEWLRSKPEIVFSSYTYQMSLAHCWNMGIAAYYRAGAHEVMVCNNDILLRPDTYRLLRDNASFFVSCISVDKAVQLGAVGDRNARTLMESERPHPDFSCFMIRKSVTARVGDFDTSYQPAYFEDNDYHVRMHRAGINAVCVDLPFLHLSAQTIKNCDESERIRIKRGADKNRERFRAKYGCVPGTPEYDALFV